MCRYIRSIKRIPKYRDSEFFDPRDIVQVKCEMPRRVSVDNATVAGATEGRVEAVGDLPKPN